VSSKSSTFGWEGSLGDTYIAIVGSILIHISKDIVFGNNSDDPSFWIRVEIRGDDFALKSMFLDGRAVRFVAFKDGHSGWVLTAVSWVLTAIERVVDWLGKVSRFISEVCQLFLEVPRDDD